MSLDVKERILALSKNQYLTDWEVGFCESIQMSIEKWGNLTPKQHNLLQKVEGKYTEEKMQEIVNWKDNFTPELRHRVKIAANYYANYAGYYIPLARKVMYEESYIPTREEYIKLCENDYATGVIDNALSDPKYPVGTFVTVRSSHPDRYKFKDKLLLIIEHSADVKSHAKGAKPVLVLPVGEAQTMWTEERYLKQPKKKKS